MSNQGQKKFQRGLLALIGYSSCFAFIVTCFCVTRVDPNAVHHVSHDPGGWTYVDESGLQGDAQVIANHCIDEGYVQKPEDIAQKHKEMVVAEIPFPKGPENAYGSAAVIGVTASHAVPGGQRMLPYHVSEKLQQDKVVFDKE